MDGGKGSLPVDGSLARKRKAMIGISVVNAGIEEIVACKSIAAVELGGGLGRGWSIGNEATVEVGIDCVDIRRGQAAMQGGFPPQTEAEVCQMGVVLLGELGSCPVVAVGDDGTDAAIGVQGCIQGAIGGKGGELPCGSQAQRGGGTVQIAGRRPGSMGGQDMGAAPQ